MIDRRILLASVASLFGLAAFRWLRVSPAQAAEKFEVEKTDAEWRAQLTPQQYEILRQEGTERPDRARCSRSIARASSPAPAATCRCSPRRPNLRAAPAGRVFISRSRTPSARPKTARFGMLRTEIHCRRCGGHLGHVFNDGPKPTGLRYCMDGFALLFHPAAPSST